MSQAKRRSDRIRAEIPILRLLEDYGYHVSADMDREQQFSCDLHGDGFDRKPSARAYTDTNTWYCFTCDRIRDPIQTVREKEGVDFWSAVKLLELKYKLPALPWEQDESYEPDTIQQDVQRTLNWQTTYAEEVERNSKMLLRITKERSLPMYLVTSLWGALDYIKHQHEIQSLSEHAAMFQLQKIREKVLECLKESDT